MGFRLYNKGRRVDPPIFQFRMKGAHRTKTGRLEIPPNHTHIIREKSWQKEDTGLANPDDVINTLNFTGGPYTDDDIEDEQSGMGGKYLKVAQRLSRPVVEEYEDDQGEPWLGKFYISEKVAEDSEDEQTEFNAPMEKITVVPVRVAAKRQLWDRDGEEFKVQCRAIGSKFSTLIGEGFPGGPCKDCPKSKWKTNEKGKRTVDCDQVRSYVVYVVEWSELCVWDLSKTTAPVAKEIRKWLISRGGGSPKDAYLNCAIELQAVEVIKGGLRRFFRKFHSHSGRLPCAQERTGSQAGQQRLQESTNSESVVRPGSLPIGRLLGRQQHLHEHRNLRGTRRGRNVRRKRGRPPPIEPKPPFCPGG